MTELIKRNSFQFLGDYIVNGLSPVVKENVIHVSLAETVNKRGNNEENFLPRLQQPPGSGVENLVFSNLDSVIV